MQKANGKHIVEGKGMKRTKDTKTCVHCRCVEKKRLKNFFGFHTYHALEKGKNKSSCNILKGGIGCMFENGLGSTSALLV